MVIAVRVLSSVLRSASSLPKPMIPVGTTVTRKGTTGQKGRVLIVKPVAKAYVLSKMSLAEWLLQRKWPVLAAILVALSLHIVELFGVCSEILEYTGRRPWLAPCETTWVVGAVCTGVVLVTRPTWVSWLTGTSTCVLLGFALFCVTTRVHSQLLRMTFSSFDPWAIIFSMVRACAAKIYSRHVVHLAAEYELEVHSYFGYLIIDTVVFVELSALLIITEAADVPKDFTRGFVAICLCYSVAAALISGIDHDLPDWDRSSTVDFLFFSSMAPLSQYFGAFQVIALLLAKAAASTILLKQDFMYLRCHYDSRLRQGLDPGGGSRRIDVEPSKIHFEDFATVLESWGISDDAIFAGFHRLDVEQVGYVGLNEFKVSLRGIFSEFPDASDTALFTRFCHNALTESMCYTSLSSMLATVFGQWRKLRIDQNFTCHPEIQRIFRDDRMRTQALLFGAFVHAALDSLREKDFIKTARTMTSLGLRHQNYGIKPAHLCLFQLAILNTLEMQLKGLSEVAWSVVWTYFVTSSFLRGLVYVDSDREFMLGTVSVLINQAQEAPNYVSSLIKNMKMVFKGDAEQNEERGSTWITLAHSPSGKYYLNNRREIFHEETQEHTHLATLLDFLSEVVEQLTRSDVASARRLIRSFAQVSWERKIRPRYMLVFQHAMAVTYRELGFRFTPKMETVWMFFMHCEILEVFVLEPYASNQLKVEEWGSNLGQEDVDYDAWKKLTPS
eukprot:g21251.t1